MADAGEVVFDPLLVEPAPHGDQLVRHERKWVAAVIGGDPLAGSSRHARQGQRPPEPRDPIAPVGTVGQRQRRGDPAGPGST